MEALNDDRMVAKLIDAQDVFDEEFPPGSRKRAEMEASLAVSLERRIRRNKSQRMERVILRAVVGG